MTMPLPYYRPPTPPEPEPEVEVEPDETVNEWRHAQLLRAGWSEPWASMLACDHHVDLHHACELLERGCDPLTALHILT